MTLPTAAQLAAYSHAELLALVTPLCDEGRRLQADVARLTPPLTSRNSSLPPSRDQKPALPPNPARKKHGLPFGHARHTRPLADDPTQVVVAPVTQYQHCQADLQTVAPEQVSRRQLTARPVVVPVVLETQQHTVAEGRGSDCYSAPLKAQAQVFQLCLALFQRVLRLLHEFDSARPTRRLTECVAETARLDEELDELLTWASPSDERLPVGVGGQRLRGTANSAGDGADARRATAGHIGFVVGDTASALPSCLRPVRNYNTKEPSKYYDQD
jgi:hypothetical protein